MLNYSFPIKLESTYLKFDDSVSVSAENNRQLSDLKEVLSNQKGIDFDCTIYKMYRGVCKLEDKEKITEIRHDLTSIPAGVINGEFVKTYGHYHPKIGNLTYPEIYQIINGKAIFILQDDIDNLKNVFFIFAQAPEIVIIPPNFGHVTINPSHDHLVLSNLIFNHLEPLYEPYQEKSGASYYITEGTPFAWSANKNYSNVPEPRFFQPNNPWGNQYLYDLSLNKPENLHFLSEPQNFNFALEEIFIEKPITEINNNLNL
ncbi:MAG: glucose-6-phosphate isomerase family protein [Patescibacteria group bacterium]|nr:glucose-6-phosphate isomerase family protein [Patescibacteria group bacterium]